MSHRYTPYYCEENVWWILAGGPPADQDAGEPPHRLGPRAAGPPSVSVVDGHAIFIINEHRSVALWSQRASDRPDGLTLWDYHVVALGRLERGGPWHVVDLDCTAGPTLPVWDWVGATFPFAGAVPEDVAPLFRIVPADDLFEQFHTDRSHMRSEGGGWLAPPPQWDPLSDHSNLAEFRDPENRDVPGAVIDLDTLIERFAERPA